ncbi:MAG: hypothetical protein AB8B77_09050 [Alphaproteobacteria bacterium]
MKRIRHIPKPVEIYEGTPFNTPEEAWFWAYISHKNILDGAKILAGKSATQRPCDPRDIILQLNKLSHQGKLKSHHFKVLMKFGARQTPPDFRVWRQRTDAYFWEEAMIELGKILHPKGIVSNADIAAQKCA